MICEKKEIILKVENVSITLGGRKIIDNINFIIRNIVRPGVKQGQIVALTGPSGTGKSTLFNAMAGLYELDFPNTGTILVGCDQKPVKVGDMGVVYQNYYLYPHRTIGWILNDAVKENTDIAEVDREEAVNQVAEQFGISGVLKKYPNEISGGQKQRAAIAEQLLNGGDFLLLDEPLSGLDLIMIRKVTDLIVKISLTDEMKTIFIVSHDIENACAIADTVFIMNHIDKEKPELGSTITKEICLIDKGLAWRPNIKQMPEFQQVITEIENSL